MHARHPGLSLLLAHKNSNDLLLGSTKDKHRTASATMTAAANANARTIAALVRFDEDAQVQQAEPARSARARFGWASLFAAACVRG